MNHFALLLSGMAMIAAPALAARETVGVYKGWAAFRDDAPPRCFAITAPQVPGGGAFASVASWADERKAGRRVAGQVMMRLYRQVREGSAILLTIDGRVFQLVGRGAEAWARGPAEDRAIVAAMRSGVSMTVSARDERGNAFTHSYALGGAATAIDAALLACPRTD